MARRQPLAACSVEVQVLRRLDALGPPQCIEGAGALLAALRPRMLVLQVDRPAAWSRYEWTFPRLDEVLSLFTPEGAGSGEILLRDHLHQRRVQVTRTLVASVERALVWQLPGPRRRLAVWSRPVVGAYYQTLDGVLVRATGNATRQRWTSYNSSSYYSGGTWTVTQLPPIPRLVRRYTPRELWVALQAHRERRGPLPAELRRERFR